LNEEPYKPFTINELESPHGPSENARFRRKVDLRRMGRGGSQLIGRNLYVA
jgi:hypothetical protein